jgi:general secretion pathway protein E
MMAQRLVRVLCPACREPVKPDADTLREMGLTMEECLAADGHLYHGRGCDACRGTGYRGRMGIYELMPLDDSIRPLIMQHANASTIRAAAIERGMHTLLQDGAQKVLKGLTTAEELLRVTQESD